MAQPNGAKNSENISMSPIQVSITRKSAPAPARPNSSESSISPKPQIKNSTINPINQETATAKNLNPRNQPQDKQLNVFLKGKRLKTAPLAAILPNNKKLSIRKQSEYTNNRIDDNNDEGIDDIDEDEDAEDQLSNSDTDEILKLYPTYNTPATIRMTTANELVAVTTSYEEEANEDGGILFTTTMMTTTEISRTRGEEIGDKNKQRAVKPAILPALGTTSCARMTERPKPAKKYKTVLLPSERPETFGAFSSSGRLTKHVNSPNLDQDDDNDEFSSQVRELLNEAKRIANSSSKKPRRQSNKQSPTKSQFEPSSSAAGIKEYDENEDNRIEKKLLQSVESLILGIKSGQLLHEQERSNKRIQEILATILDKESLNAFDFSLGDEQEPQIEVEMNVEENKPPIEVSQTVVQEQKEAEREQEVPKIEVESRPSEREVAESIGDRIKGEDNTIKVDYYQDEIDLYLASLPPKVTNEDIINASVSRLRLHERPGSSRPKGLVQMERYLMTRNDSDREQRGKLSLEERFARNLHLFCMYEHERRSVLLLSDELIDVTRKYHTRDRYEHSKPHLTYSSGSPESTMSNMRESTASLKENLNSRQAEINKEMIHDLYELEAAIPHERVKSVNYSSSKELADQEEQLSTTNDSGVGDEIESWRLKAENKIQSAFKLSGTGVNLIELDDMKEYSLTFLRPAPPKMSLRPSFVRERLFPKYKSIEPPSDEIIGRRQKAGSRQQLETPTAKFFKKSTLDLLLNEDDLENEESLIAEEMTIEKLLTRQYNSETDLRTDSGYFEQSTNLVRCLSDSILGRRKARTYLLNDDNDDTQRDVDDDEDYEFLKIDSNYNYALEEAMSQKKKIKSDYLKRKQTESAQLEMSTNKFKASIGSLKTPVSGFGARTNSSKLEELSSDSGLDSWKTSLLTDKSSRREFFPKIYKKTLAEMALEAGRNYILYPEKQGEEKKKKRRVSKLNLDLLDKIEQDIYEANKKVLLRSESMDRIKFRPKIFQPEDSQLRLLRRNALAKRRPSLPRRMDFEAFKAERSAPNMTSVYDEREWTREVWCEWFDEVIPLLDGTFAKDAKSRKNDTDAEGIRFSEVIITNESSSKVNETGAEGEMDQVQEDDDEDVEPGHKRLVKSPTPYSEFAHVDLDLSTVSDMETIKLIEHEIELLTRQLNNKRINAFDLTRRATLYRKLGFIKKALDDLNLALEMEFNFVDAHWQRHLVYLVQDRKADALEELNTILKFNRNHAGAYLSRGDLFVEKNDIQLAIVNYSQAIKYNPNDYQAYYKRAKLYEQRGDFRMAMDDFLSTTKLNPKIADAWFKHGLNYFNSKNWHYAIVDFTELIKNNPLHQAQARLYRGKCYLNLEDYQAALEDFCTALHLNPNDWEAYYHRACLLRKINPEQALLDYSISLLIQSGYENLNSYLHRAIIYTEFEQFDEAIKDYESVLELDKEFAPAYVNLGVIYMNLTMNYWKAIKHFNMAIKSNPVYIRAYLCRAQAYRNVHDLKRAFLDYTRAIHLDPMNTQIYIYRGQVMLEMGDLKMAAFCVQHAAFMNDISKQQQQQLAATSESVQQAPKLLPLQQQIANNQQSSMSASVKQQALVFAFLKDYDKSIATLEYELKLKPPSGELCNLLGRVYMKAKKWEKAAEAFDKTIEHNITVTKNPNRSTTTLMMSIPKIVSMMSKTARQEMIDAFYMKGQSYMELYKFDQAHKSFEKVIEIEPKNARAYYYRGLCKARMNNPKSILDFNKSLSLEPNLFEAFLGRACVYGSQGRFTKAILNCNQAVRLNPRSVRAFLYRGALKYHSKSFDQAIIDLTEAIRLDQTCALAYFNRALCHHHLKNFYHALKDYSIVLMLGDYLNYKAYINRALLYFDSKDYFNSMRDFSAASVFSPDNYNIQHMIGVCLHKLERYNEAIEKLTEAYHINTNLQEALISRGNVYVDLGHAEAFAKAQRDYEHVLLRDQNNMDANINLAYLLQMTGRFKRAWDQFTSAMMIRPNLAELYEGRSIVCLQMSDTAAALKDINHAMKIKSSAELFVNRGVIYQFMADNVNAMRDYQSAILMNRNYALAYYNSANILLMHRQYKQAVEHLDKAIDMCGMRDESSYQNRAIAKAMNEDFSSAFRDLCEALKYSTFAAHIYMNRAVVLSRLENYQLAEKDFTSAINLTPNDPLLYKLRADCRGKMNLREESIEDYKLACSLQEREEMRKTYGVKLKSGSIDDSSNN